MRITRSCVVLTLALVAPVGTTHVAWAAPTAAASAAGARAPAAAVRTAATPDVALDEVAVPLRDAPAPADAPVLAEGRDPDALPLPPGATRLEGPVVESDDTVQTVGITWAEGTGDGALDAQVRYLSDGTWSPWLALETDAGGPDPGTPDAARQRRDGTSSLWVGDADGVQVAFTVAPGAEAPQDVEVALLSTEITGAAVAPAGGAGAVRGAAVPAPAAAVTATAASAPGVVTRAQWGARAPSCTPDTASTLVGAVVHHTAGPDYASPAEAMAQLRNDQRYHMDSRGWCDLGYNIVVDKWGTLYEGRVGSLTSPVVGVHAGGFNTGTLGVSVLGTYTDVGFTPATTDAIARIVAWRLAAYGRSPGGEVVIHTNGGENSRYGPNSTVRLPVVFAHRDVAYTTCPGNAGYAAMGAIRARAQQIVDGYGTSRLGGTLVRASGAPDVYLTTATTKHRLTDATMLDALRPLGAITVVQQVQVDQLGDGVPVGRFLRDRDGVVALVERGRLHRVDSCAELEAWGRSCGDYGAMAVPDPVMSLLQPGPDLTTAYVTPQWQYFLVHQGRRHEITDAEALAAWPVQSNGPAVELDASVGLHLPYGAPVVRTGVVVQDRASGDAVLLDRPAGLRLSASLVSASRITDRLPLRPLDPGSMAALVTPRGVLDGALRTSDGGRVALTAGGAVRLTSSQVPGDPGVPVEDAVVSALSPAAPASTLFARTGADPTLFLIDGSVRREVLTMDAANALTGGRGVVAAFVSAAGLGQLATGPAALGPGRLVKAPDAVTVYLVDGLDRLVPLPSFDQALAAGVPTSWSEAPAATVAAYRRAPQPLGMLWRCGGTDHLAREGRLHPLPSGVLPASGAPAQALHDLTCAAAPRAAATWQAPVFARTADDPTLYLLTDAVRRPVPTMDTVTALLGGRPLGVATVPAAALAAVPTGPTVLPPGRLVKTPDRPDVLLVDGLGRSVFLPSFAVAEALGVPTTFTEVPTAWTTAYPRAANPLSQLLRCGGTSLVGVGGVLRPLPAGTVAADGTPATTVDTVTCGALRQGTPLTGPVFVRSAGDPTLYLLEGGTRRPVTTMDAAYRAAAGGALVVAVVPQPALDRLPTGAPLR
ncbi:peptidoglycan recognition protein family protein [Cellulomonas shaoxiangyii]|uniref:N-acetylmuramoyl-L-alanine amidase n=1 Tax=Cellulomonas shaoxiangyii TaxID=2566013 RepID=A0A4P7SJ65_9CELL|nr:peptidoglycan recognition protein [Cellulomonas shaoxiangyii]QCB93136.1 hypothetical protein E5225_05790 [Cellulomonas shaoxiangyii]TGY84795.1 hypothetical protein E5226_09600 [Cellulomonas shaoxiangyii]